MSLRYGPVLSDFHVGQMFVHGSIFIFVGA